jgi:hypothetical protein
MIDSENFDPNTFRSPSLQGKGLNKTPTSTGKAKKLLLGGSPLNIDSYDSPLFEENFDTPNERKE